MKTTLLLDHDTPSAHGSLLVRALLRIEGDLPERRRAPLNLSLVLDRSGSMSGGKLEAAKHAARLVVRRLGPADRVSVVAFDDAVRVVSRPATGGETHDVENRIAALGPGGSTNLSGGWLKGHELTAGARVDGVNRVLLLTDGQANVGITDAGSLAGLCRAAAAAGVSTTTIGFGADFDEALLRAMADAGGGNAWYIEHADQAASVFGEELEGLLTLAAQNVSVEVRTGADVQLAAVHHSYPRSEADGALRLELGDLYAREPRTLLVELQVGAAALAGPAGPLELGTLVIRGDVLTAEGGVERRELSCHVRMTPGEGPRVEPEVRRELVLLRTARSREEALERQRVGDFHGAAMALRDVALAVRAHGVEGDERLAEEARDLEAMAAEAAVPMKAMDLKYLYQRAYEASRSRSEAYKRVSRERREDPS